MNGPIPERVVLDTMAVSKPFLSSVAGRIRVVVPAVVIAEHARQGYRSSLENRGFSPAQRPYDPQVVKTYVQSLVETYRVADWKPEQADWGCLSFFDAAALHAFGQHFGEQFTSRGWESRSGWMDAAILATAISLRIPLVSNDDEFFGYLDGVCWPNGCRMRYRTGELVSVLAGGTGASA